MIPNTSTPVAIDNVNNGNAGFGPGLGPCVNCGFYIENHAGATVEYDGFTTVLTAFAVVLPCETYRMKLVVADALDDVVDSGVFLEAGSFSSGEAVAAEVTAHGPLFEGCTDDLFTFTRLDASTLGQEATVQFSVSGTATAGADYTAFPSSIIIPAGEMSVSLGVEALLDFTPEGDETITITLTNTECSCTPTSPPEATAIISDNDTPLSVTTSGSITICEGQSADLSATPAGSLTPYSIVWDNTAGNGSPVTVTPDATTTFTVTIEDACGTQQVTSSETVTVVSAGFGTNTIEQCFENHQFDFNNQGFSDAGVTYAWDFGDGNSSTQENPSHTYAAPGSYTVTQTVTWTASGCESVFFTEVELWEHPDATASTTQDVTCTQQGAVTVSVSGGVEPYDYLWSTGATTATVSNLAPDTYTVTVTDDNGCEGTSQATVANVSSGPPTANCQDLTVQLNDGGMAIVFASQVNDGSIDACGIASLAVSPATFNCSNIGPNTVTLTVENVDGLTATCTATVNVEDNISPEAVCQNITVQLDAGGNATITAADVDGGSTDNCAITSLSVSPNTFTCADIGPNTVTLTVEDASGNSHSCTATVTVEENVPPVAVCQDITIQLDINGNASITAVDVDGGSTDNCGIASLSVSPNSFTCADAGANTVTLTVTDGSGNSTTCTATVTVETVAGLTAICQDVTVQLDANGSATIATTDIDNGSGADCGTANLSLDRTDFDCSGLGANTVTLTVDDGLGNTESCTATVTVQDNIPPTAVCQDITVQVGGAGSVTIIADAIDNGSTDNCGIASMSVSPNSFTCADAGANTVTLTVTDGSGNSTTCTATVTVETVAGLTAICQDVTVQLDANGSATIATTDIDNGSGADCGTANLSLDRTDFDCSGLGANTVTLTASDGEGNTESCSATVTVVDEIPPVFTFCPFNITVQPMEGCEAEALWDIPVASDNCSVTLTSTHEPGDVFPLGMTTVTYTATDASGNAATCSFTVTVSGSQGLEISVQVNEFSCGYNVSCPGASDGSAEAVPSGGCPPYTYLWSNGQTTGTATGLSADTYGVTVTDAGGSSVSSNVELIGPEPLVFGAPVLSSYVGGINVSCKGESDGSIAITLSGGADCENYLVDWSGPGGFSASGLEIEDLMAGTYTVNARDANGCSVETSFTLTEPGALALLVSDITAVSCHGGADGSAALSATGGNEPYSLTDENGDPVLGLFNLEAGNYTVTLTDANGCVSAQTVIIEQPDPLTAEVLSITDATCNGGSDGGAQVGPLGGTAPYMVNWQGGQTGATVTGLSSGTVGFTVTDFNGCIFTDSALIGSPLPLAVDSIIVTNVSCQGGADGNALAQVSGGTEPYTFTWPPSALSDNPATGFATGNFTLNVVDANGCATSRPFIVAQPPPISVTLSGDTSVCAGESAIVSISASGGAGGFIFEWDNGLGAGAQHLVSPTAPTTFGVTVTDANGCEVQVPGVTVGLYPSPEAAFTVDVVDECVLPTEFVTTNTSTGAISYNWYQGTQVIGATTPEFSYNEPGTYTVALVAENMLGCTDSASVSVTVHAPPVADFAVSNPDGCLPVSTVFTSTGTGGFSYEWDFGNGATSNLGSVGQTYFEAGSYDVTLIVTSAIGCTDMLSVDSAVTVFDLPVADFTMFELDSELGGLFEFINSSTGAVTYSWSFGDGNFTTGVSPIHEYTSPGDFSVTLTAVSAEGCIDTMRVTRQVDIRKHLYVPNALQVGNSSGAGVFRPVGVGLAEYRAMVFDKWGNLLWESTDMVGSSPSGEWDGSYQGKLVPQGAYIWSVEGRFLDGTLWDGTEGPDGKRYVSGSITVLY